MTDLAPLVPIAAELIGACAARGLKIATAESCTGGLVAALLTEIPGSSAVVDRAFVTYANGAKTEMLGVPPELIDRNGAVSEAVARAMAEGALAHSDADLVVAVTGIAGPTGGTAEKPVGLVHLAAARRNGPLHHSACVYADRDRAAVRLAASREALAMLRGLFVNATTGPAPQTG